MLNILICSNNQEKFFAKRHTAAECHPTWHLTHVCCLPSATWADTQTIGSGRGATYWRLHAPPSHSICAPPLLAASSSTLPQLLHAAHPAAASPRRSTAPPHTAASPLRPCAIHFPTRCSSTLPTPLPLHRVALCSSASPPLCPRATHLPACFYSMPPIPPPLLNHNACRRAPPSVAPRPPPPSTQAWPPSRLLCPSPSPSPTALRPPP